MRTVPALHCSVVLLATLTARPLAAQCPDGTPPPCRAAAARAARTAAPDPRTWIVLPFSNVTRESDLAWLTSASVNLLYLDLSRWSDIRVIDDGRVTDLVRTLPATQREELGLGSGLALARQAGAGRLVMGDLVNSGSRTTVIAKVYDVTSGRRVRTVSDQFATRDSTMPAYARLAGQIVDAALPRGASRDAVGTNSLDAYQEYHAGLQALQAWQLAEAERRFARALQIDTSFALAHYRFSLTIGWDSGFAPSVILHADAAARLTAGLPARERALIRGMQQFVHHEYADACETFASLIAADSADVEAWYQLGECSYHDNVVRPVTADSSVWRFRSSWRTAYRVFSRTLVLDPAMHLAYEHLLDMLRQDYRGACLDRCQREVRAMVVVQGDSVFADSAEVSQPRRGFDTYVVDESVRGPRLGLAQTIALRWLATAPEEAEAHYQYGLVLQEMHRFSEAATEVGAARRLGQRENPYRENPRLLHLSLIMRSDSQFGGAIPAAVQLVDSILREAPRPARDTTRRERARASSEAFGHAALAGLVGSFARIPERFPPWLTWDVPPGYYRALSQLSAGVVPRNLEQVLRALSDSTDTTASYRNFRRGAHAAVSTLCWGLCTPTGVAVPQTVDPLATLARGDTAAARSEAQRQDSMQEDSQRRYGSVGLVGSIAAAQAQLALRDTAAALRGLERIERSWLRNGYIGLGPYGTPDAWLLGRTWLLKADLLVATGRRDEARVYYRRVADLWSHGDPEVQPFVQRARAAAPNQ